MKAPNVFLVSLCAWAATGLLAPSASAQLPGRDADIEAILADARVVGLADQPELIVPMDNPAWAQNLGITGAMRRYKGICGPDGAQATIGMLFDHARRDLERDLGRDGHQTRATTEYGNNLKLVISYNEFDPDIVSYMLSFYQAASYMNYRIFSHVTVGIDALSLDFSSDSDPSNDNVAGSAGTVQYLLPWPDYVEGLRVATFRDGPDLDLFAYGLDHDSVPVLYDGAGTPTQETQVIVSMPQLRAIFGDNILPQTNATSIILNTNVNWKLWNPSCNPLTPTQASLDDVIVHEMTHALGFSSNLQPFVVQNNSNNQIQGLDVARFLPADLPVNDPNPGDNSRLGEGYIAPSDVHYYRDDTDGGDGQFQTLLEQGDDAQPSHLQSRSAFVDKLGIMDPFIIPGTTRCPNYWTRSDTEPLRNMGWRVLPLSTLTDCNGNGIPDEQDVLKGTSADNDGDLIPDECQYFNPPDATPSTPQSLLATTYNIPESMDLGNFDPMASGVTLHSEQYIASTFFTINHGSPGRRITTYRFSVYAPNTSTYAFRVAHAGAMQFRFSDFAVYQVNGHATLALTGSSQPAPQVFIPLMQGWHEMEIRVLTTAQANFFNIVRESYHEPYQDIPLSDIRAADSNFDCDSDGTPDFAELDCDADGTPDDCQVFDGPFPYLGEAIPVGTPGESVIIFSTAGSSFDTEIALWQLGVFDQNDQHPLVATNDNFLFSQQSTIILNNPTPGFYVLAITGADAEFGPLDPAFADGGILVNQGGCAPGGSINYAIGNLSGSGTLGGGRVAFYLFDIGEPPLACNDADLAEPFGILDLADVNAFITGFTSQQPAGDLNNDGVWDLTDIGIFINAFTAGCP
ncbi:MAG: hypothetical protein H6810_07890 [Phycisphaeraceae bacterium]|nr:MAG: hypothetical protein H6810_07890 [Phycisphaeraceae bacterium]